jgi:hypothetical protein
MPKAKRKLALVEQLMAEASAILAKAQAFATMDMGQTAQPLWTSAASLQERIAPLLDANGESREAEDDFLESGRARAECPSARAQAATATSRSA